MLSEVILVVSRFPSEASIHHNVMDFRFPRLLILIYWSQRIRQEAGRWRSMPDAPMALACHE